MGKRTTWPLVCVIARISMKGVIGKGRAFLEVDPTGSFENYHAYFKLSHPEH